MTPRKQWLTQIRSNPSDWQSMLVFADWLEDAGDLLAAEQWRWIAATDDGWISFFVQNWLSDGWGKMMLWNSEKQSATERQIRCMPTYPTSLEDVERYYRELETVQ